MAQRNLGKYPSCQQMVELIDSSKGDKDKQEVQEYWGKRVTGLFTFGLAGRRVAT